MAYQPTITDKAVLVGIHTASTVAGVVIRTSVSADPANTLPFPLLAVQGALMGAFAPFFLTLVLTLALFCLQDIAKLIVWVLLQIVGVLVKVFRINL